MTRRTYHSHHRSHAHLHRRSPHRPAHRTHHHGQRSYQNHRPKRLDTAHGIETLWPKSGRKPTRTTEPNRREGNEGVAEESGAGKTLPTQMAREPIQAVELGDGVGRRRERSAGKGRLRENCRHFAPRWSIIPR